MKWDTSASGERFVSRWETRDSKDGLILYQAASGLYGYCGKDCGGALPAKTHNDADAIKWMDNPWDHPDGAGAAFVLRSARPSLKRV